MKPYVVLCMAGRYRRFREAGYITPKYLLALSGAPILASVIQGLGPDRLLLVANERDRTFEGPIRDAVRAAGVEDYALRFIGDTIGQAETAAIGARRVLEDGWHGPLLFHNVDTVVRGRDLEAVGALLEAAEGFIDVFPESSAAYSYVALSGNRVTDIAEKVVISRHATTGLYGFRSAASYLEAAEATRLRSASAFPTSRAAGAEFYVSDVYRTILERGGDLRADPVGGAHETVVLGTPAEYEAAVRELGE